MLLFVGLGNPGAEYEKSRHNIGFMAVNEIVRRYNFTDEKEKFKGLISSGSISEEKIITIKPQTYMNLSGEAVLSIMSFYKIKPENIYVFHDDMDIALGKVKVKIAGSSAGHNGIKSIDNSIGNKYNRIRIGVGKPINNNVVNYVLGNFTSDDNNIKNKVLEVITDNIEVLIQQSNDKFASKIGEKLKNGI